LIIILFSFGFLEMPGLMCGYDWPFLMSDLWCTPALAQYRKALELGQAKRPVRVILRQPKPELEAELGPKPKGKNLIAAKPQNQILGNFGSSRREIARVLIHQSW
jgi:hypothetical protein